MSLPLAKRRTRARINPEQLRRARYVLGLSQAEMAKMLGISRRQLIRYEKGDARTPGPVAVAVNLIMLDIEREAYRRGLTKKRPRAYEPLDEVIERWARDHSD